MKVCIRIISSALFIMLIAFPACPRDINSELITAADEGHWETVQVLLDAGADANAEGEEGMTALMAAAYAGHTQTVKALLDAGAEVDARDNDGWTALMQVTNGGTEIVKILLDAGADLEAKNLGITVSDSEKYKVTK